MERVDRDVAVELRHDPLRPLREPPGVFRGPPVAQVALGVELAPLVVEAMRELVADHRPDRPVVDRIVGRWVEIRRLEDPGREHDLVERRVVVGIHGRRRHPPLGLVHRTADLRELAPLLELARLQHVRGVGPHPSGLERRVVPPVVRVPDLLDDRVEFGEGVSLG